MNRLTLSNWEKRPYGERASGVVRTADREIPIRVRRPDRYAADSKTYLMANGWTAGKNSMRIPAIEAAKFGHTAVTFKYTNTKSRDALRQNVQDVSDIIQALPRSERKAAIGLSMGGAVVTMALEHIGQDIDRATLVAPGKYLHARYYSPWLIARHLLAEAGEVRHARRDMRTSLHLLADGIANCASRPQAIPAELRELLDGNVHDELRRTKAQHDAPFVRFMYGLDDRLLPAEAQLDSIAGLPFDEIMPFTGGHARLAYDPTLAAEIFMMEDQALAA
jgi:pimeloyl-ACP methyl ester carboxylesterase